MGFREYGDSPYSTANGGLAPPNLGDDRPARMYIYDIPSQTVRDITPKLGGSPPASVCGPTGSDPLCTDLLWNQTFGVRSAASYVEPTTGNTYVIVTGPGIFETTNFFVWGIAENRWVGKYRFIGYSDIRHWVQYQNVLYAAAFKPVPATGSPGRTSQIYGKFYSHPCVESRTHQRLQRNSVLRYGIDRQPSIGHGVLHSFPGCWRLRYNRQ